MEHWTTPELNKKLASKKILRDFQLRTIVTEEGREGNDSNYLIEAAKALKCKIYQYSTVKCGRQFQLFIYKFSVILLFSVKVVHCVAGAIYFM